MPGPLASPELARKTRERLPDVAVLFTSGYTDNAIVHAGRLDPGIELLSKPYTREALARKIRHVMKSRSQADAAKRSEAAVERATADPDAPKHPMTILLVEDESLIRLATAELLGELGHTVVQAANGHDALALLRTSAVDVLMADLGLPDMHGHHLAVEARQRLPRLPVIFATGNADPFDKGADRITHAITLRKPYDLASLTDALETARKSIPQPPGA
jgi:CheY-like chemotaxis protein